jgi:hypothetical protein
VHLIWNGHGVGFGEVAGTAEGLTIRERCLSSFAPRNDVIGVKVSESYWGVAAFAMAAGLAKQLDALHRCKRSGFSHW